MACSLIRTLDQDEDDLQRAKVPGRIVTTLPKAKELRPFIEKLITLARKGRRFEDAAPERVEKFERNADGSVKLDSRKRPAASGEWKTWRESSAYQEWNQAMAPAVNCRRRAFALLRDQDAVAILFDTLADRFADRPGGYTRILKLAKIRLGDAGQQALIEFVGEDDEVMRRDAPVVSDEDDETDEAAASEDVSDDDAGVEVEETAEAEETAVDDEEEASAEAAESEGETADEPAGDGEEAAEPQDEGEADAEDEAKAE